MDGYIGYVILYLKEDNQESAQILSSLMEAIRQGDRAEIAQETQRYFLSLAEIMRQHMKDWESAEASIRKIKLLSAKSRSRQYYVKLYCREI